MHSRHWPKSPEGVFLLAHVTALQSVRPEYFHDHNKIIFRLENPRKKAVQKPCETFGFSVYAGG
jgi:hypothetical protein